MKIHFTFFKLDSRHIANVFIREIQTFPEDCGDIPEELTQKLLEEHEADVMEAWLKLAAKVNSISEFMEKMDAERESTLCQRRTEKT